MDARGFGRERVQLVAYVGLWTRRRVATDEARHTAETRALSRGEAGWRCPPGGLLSDGRGKQESKCNILLQWAWNTLRVATLVDWSSKQAKGQCTPRGVLVSS